MLDQQLVHAAALVDRAGNEHERGPRVRLVDDGFQLIERAGRRFTLTFGNKERVGLQDDHDPLRRHHWQRPDGGHERRDAVGELVGRCQVASMDPLDVEGAKSLVDERGEFAGERRLLDVVFTLEKVNRINPARLELLADCGGGC